MMKSYILEPEVAGGLGNRTIIDVSVHPPIVHRLHYEFAGWDGDALLESFPIFIVTLPAQQALISIAASGVQFDVVDVTTSNEYKELYPEQQLPKFVWLKPIGQAGQDDISTIADGRLVVSERVLNTLKALGLINAIVEPFVQ